MRRLGLTHLNGDLLCAIDCETSGEVPGYHDLLQVCVLPLDYKLEPWTDITPFYMLIQPKRPEYFGKKSEFNDLEVQNRIKKLFCQAQVDGVEPYKAADLFDEWIKNLKLAYNKRIAPLAQNWPFDREFIIDWLGRESFKQYFDPRFRDTMASACYDNDRADFRIEPVPYNKVNLTWLCRVHKIENPRAHDALADCIATAKLYKSMVMM